MSAILPLTKAPCWSSPWSHDYELVAVFAFRAAVLSMMKAVVCTKYGPPEVLVVKQVPKPSPAADEVLIRIHATTVTASDVLIRQMAGNLFMRLLLKAVFGFRRPRQGQTLPI